MTLTLGNSFRRTREPLPPFLSPSRIYALASFAAFNGTVLSQMVMFVTASSSVGCGAAGYLTGASLLFIFGPCVFLAWVCWSLLLVHKRGSVVWRSFDVAKLAKMAVEWRRGRVRRLEGGRGVSASAPAAADKQADTEEAEGETRGGNGGSEPTTGASAAVAAAGPGVAEAATAEPAGDGAGGKSLHSSSKQGEAQTAAQPASKAAQPSRARTVAAALAERWSFFVEGLNLLSSEGEWLPAEAAAEVLAAGAGSAEAPKADTLASRAGAVVGPLMRKLSGSALAASQAVGSQLSAAKRKTSRAGAPAGAAEGAPGTARAEGGAGPAERVQPAAEQSSETLPKADSPAEPVAPARGSAGDREHGDEAAASNEQAPPQPSPPPSPPPTAAPPAASAPASAPAAASASAASPPQGAESSSHGDTGATAPKSTSRAGDAASKVKSLGRELSRRLSAALAGAPAATDGSAPSDGVALLASLGVLFESRRGPATAHLPIEMARVALRTILLVSVPATSAGAVGTLVILLEIFDTVAVVAWRPFVERKQNYTRAALSCARLLHVFVLFCGGWAGFEPNGAAVALAFLQAMAVLLVVASAANSAWTDLAAMRAESAALRLAAATAAGEEGSRAMAAVGVAAPLYAKVLARATASLTSVMPQAEGALRACALDAYAAAFVGTPDGGGGGGEDAAKDATAHLTHPMQERRQMERKIKAKARLLACTGGLGSGKGGGGSGGEAETNAALDALFGGDEAARAQGHAAGCAALQSAVVGACHTDWHVLIEPALEAPDRPPTGEAAAEVLAGALRALLAEDGAQATRFAAELCGLGAEASEVLVTVAAPALRTVFEPLVLRKSVRMLNMIVPRVHALADAPDGAAAARDGQGGGIRGALKRRFSAKVAPIPTEEPGPAASNTHHSGTAGRYVVEDGAGER